VIKPAYRRHSDEKQPYVLNPWIIALEMDCENTEGLMMRNPKKYT